MNLADVLTHPLTIGAGSVMFAGSFAGAFLGVRTGKARRMFLGLLSESISTWWRGPDAKVELDLGADAVELRRRLAASLIVRR